MQLTLIYADSAAQGGGRIRSVRRVRVLLGEALSRGRYRSMLQNKKQLAPPPSPALPEARKFHRSLTK